MKRIEIFTDGGAFKKNTPTSFDAVSSFRIYVDKKLLHNDSLVTEDRTGPYGEMHAITLALKETYRFLIESRIEDYRINLYTDSLNSYKTLTEWIYNWMKNTKDGIFYSSSGKPVQNQDTIEEAFHYYNEIYKLDDKRVWMYHINSHVAKKNLNMLHEKFMDFNRIQCSYEDFYFIYLQNKQCDEDVKTAYTEFLKTKQKGEIEDGEL